MPHITWSSTITMVVPKLSLVSCSYYDNNDIKNNNYYDNGSWEECKVCCETVRYCARNFGYYYKASRKDRLICETVKEFTKKEVPNFHTVCNAIGLK